MYINSTNNDYINKTLLFMEFENKTLMNYYISYKGL